MRVRSKLLLAGAALLWMHEVADAQQRLHLAGGLILRQARIHSTALDITERLGSTGIGATGRVRMGWLVAEIEYFETHLTPVSGTAAERDAVEGELMVGAAPLSWLTLITGPHVRTFDTGLGFYRWVLWEFRARARLRVVPRLADAYVEARRVLAADGTVAQSWSGGAGGEAGITFTPRGGPFWIEVSYRFERYELNDGDRVDSSDGLVVSVGVRR